MIRTIKHAIEQVAYGEKITVWATDQNGDLQRYTPREKQFEDACRHIDREPLALTEDTYLVESITITGRLGCGDAVYVTNSEPGDENCGDYAVVRSDIHKILAAGRTPTDIEAVERLTHAPDVSLSV